ncbi:ATP-binding protein [Thiocystis violascens]|uniref:ATPase n=1 Tax=Thiocystis violascens (strain ATCC 17096 / DSM 198 / 6111) TaxID=765911 RepID=I3YCS4_THIV6|nr:ATP-binding protein [Thiocystis violascens]AFL74792.1 ATPase [Thiocystis violascens DSM 198]
MIHYPRTTLAEQLVAALEGSMVFSDAHNGLFLAAPRRTGKSTFLQSDLSPALERHGIVVIYVDLWADVRRDPGVLITEAIGRTLQARLGRVAKTARAAGLESLSIAGFKIDTSRIGKQDGATLPDALRALHETAQAPVTLIVDEAQHALTSEAGEATMAALKSARDQLNRPDRINLMLVMSGSDRDKLLRLVNTNGAPFFGSQIQRMPELDRGFIEHIAELIETQRPDLSPVDSATLFAAFQGFGYRPQFFMEALGQALSPLSGLTIRCEQAVLEAASLRQADDEAQMESEYLSLKPVEQAVLWRLLEQGQRFRPYDMEALRFYQEKSGVNVTAQKAQNALEALRQRTPALVWKSARGEYAVDDAAMHRWFETRVAEGRWPPQERQTDLDLFDEDT